MTLKVAGAIALVPALCVIIAAAGFAETLPRPVSSPARTVELTLGKPSSLKFESIRQYLIGDASLVTIEQPDGNTLRLNPIAIGKTFLHVWDAAGRSTLMLQVSFERVAVKAVSGRAAAEKERGEEHARALKLRYSSAYETVRSGPNLARSGLNTSNQLTQRVSGDMETPLGDLSGMAEYQRVNGFSDLNLWQTKLEQRQVGPLDQLDWTAGDTRIGFGRGSFAIPTVSYRGASLEMADANRISSEMLWGRQRTSLYGFTTGAGSGLDRDDFIYGWHVEAQDPSLWKVEGTLLRGYGADRNATASDQVIDIAGKIEMVGPLSLDQEFALADGSFGYTIGPRWETPTLRIGTTYRDIPEDFSTVTGGAQYQGERGVVLQANWHPVDPWYFYAREDVFKSRLYPNPAEPDAINQDGIVGADWTPIPGTTLSGSASRRRAMGQLFPMDSRRWSTSLRQAIPVRPLSPWVQTLTAVTRFDHQDSRYVSSPDLDYRDNTLTVGLSAPLKGSFTASAEQQWHWLRESINGEESIPRRFSAGLSHWSSFLDNTVAINGRLAYEDEGQTDSPRSPLAGQDRVVLEGGMRYRPVAFTELYADGRISRLVAEPENSQQIEFSAMTGARLDWDTRVVRWDPRMSVQGVVFHDLSGDGKRQDGEPGLPGVRLLAGLSRSAVTNDQGEFSFKFLAGKAIPVAVEAASLPKGFLLSTPAVYVVRADDKKRRPLSFGALGRAEVRGRVFEDIDRDGKYTAKDRAIGKVRLTLGKRIEKTDPSGWFSFRDLPSGPQTLTIDLATLPVHYLPQVPVQQQIELEEGSTRTIDIPVEIQRVLKGKVYVDRSRNLQWDPQEQVISGMPVCMDGNQVAKTGPDGVFQFLDIALGAHRLELNCGIRLKDYVPISKSEVTVNVGIDSPESVVVDFRLESIRTLTDEVLRSRRTITAP